MPFRIAYFINQYPKVSHSFIRREIHALERQGFDILRIALRGWDSETIDTIDKQEQKLTRYVLQDGLVPLLFATLRVLVTSPGGFFSALVLAIRTGWRAARPLPYHLIYFAEACRMLPWLKAFGAKHVHAHFGTNSAEVVMLAHALGGPGYSFTVHGPDEFDQPQALGISEKIHRAAFVVAISSYGRSQLYRWIEYACWPKIRVIHCGVEPAFHEGFLVAPPVAPRLVCVGRLAAQKGLLLLIAAASHLKKKGVKFELVIVGDGEMRSEVEALITKHAIGNQVRLTGSVSTERLREEILAARALVLPSFAEGLPGVIMEAMALRRPILTTYVAGIPELVQHGMNGWLIPAGSIDALADGMEEILSRSSEELRIMGEANYTRVLERHSIDVGARKLGKLFEESCAAATDPSRPKAEGHSRSAPSSCEK
jgi:colanic acid/amylovoran biosynthesis glycosyltransferase